MVWNIVILIFLLAAVIQLYFLSILKVPRQVLAPETDRPARTPVSVIICARNEAANLGRFLPAVLQQDYPQGLWEVIVVNDQSDDGSAAVLEQLQQQYPVLQVIHIPASETKTLPGKKYALSKGIAAARFDRLLLTDADCRPASPHWLRKMAAMPDGVTLGYGAYESRPGLLNRFIRWETAHTCMQYMSYAATGKPYMGVGRNLSYNRSLLQPLEQDAVFREIYSHTPSGDDDLLISRIARKDHTFLCTDQDAVTLSLPQTTWNAWWKQKTRHSSTGKYYARGIKRLLGLYALSHALYWFLGLPLMLYGLCSFQAQPLLLEAVILFLLRLLLYWRNALRWQQHLNEKKIGLFYPLGDLGWAFYNVFLSPYIFWKNKQAWK